MEAMPPALARELCYQTFQKYCAQNVALEPHLSAIASARRAARQDRVDGADRMPGA